MITVEETIEAIHNSHGGLTDEEIQLIVQFAFKTGDVELIQKYEAALDVKPKWVDQIENLLVAIEMYRLEEEKAVNRLADVLGAYGIHVSAEEIRKSDTEQIKQKVKIL